MALDFLLNYVNYFLHIDKYLNTAIQNYGTLVYAILFLVIFVETGLVVMPFLPGDSLLFAAGAFSAVGSLNIIWVLILLGAAAILGDSANYWIGHFIGKEIFTSKSLIFKKKYLDRTSEFYSKYGNKAVVLGRFVPIVRTFVPFIAGAAVMDYPSFFSYNVIGGLLWVGLFSFAGYFFGNIPFVKDNFSLVILAIIFLSIMPPIIEYLNGTFKVKKHKKN